MIKINSDNVHFWKETEYVQSFVPKLPFDFHGLVFILKEKVVQQIIGPFYKNASNTNFSLPIKMTKIYYLSFSMTQ